MHRQIILCFVCWNIHVYAFAHRGRSDGEYDGCRYARYFCFIAGELSRRIYTGFVRHPPQLDWRAVLMTITRMCCEENRFNWQFFFFFSNRLKSIDIVCINDIISLLRLSPSKRIKHTVCPAVNYCTAARVLRVLGISLR